ncbi:MAG: DUF4974 domain-containing protein [Bacteroidales bacterium]|nr:DUF4974 domain-containing protein [Bacteroidales bacterium]
MMNHSEQLEVLLVKYFQGETTIKENDLILQWLEQSPRNEKFFLETKLLWESGRISDIRIKDELKHSWDRVIQSLNKKSQEFVVALNAKQTQNRHIIGSIIKIAAAILIAFGSALLVYRYIHPVSSRSIADYYQFYTPNGAKSEISLPDGSVVWVNSGSTIKFPQNFSNTYREVYLEGEAYFDVKKDEKHPLVVRTSEVNIHVLGTAFNIKCYSEESTVETTLERGSIVLEFVEKSGERMKMETGQRVIYDKVKKNVVLDKSVKTRYFTAWKDGKLVFENETFENLSTRLERWYDIEITITDEELKDIRFTGTFENETIEQGLQILELTTPIDYAISKNHIYISKGK